MIYLNNKPLTLTEHFPNNELNIKAGDIAAHTAIGGNNIIAFKYQSDEDLIKLMFVKKHLDSMSNNGIDETKSMLRMLYFPYERMDRGEKFSVFTLKMVADFINWLGFTSVEITEPHSDVLPALVDRCFVRYPTIEMLPAVLGMIGFDYESDFIYYPDAGAAKRYGKMTNLPNELVGHKIRDFKTGVIKSLAVIGGEGKTLNKRKVLMIDDLCSRGGTFIMGAERLKEMGVDQVYLLVGHCENTVFDGDIPSSDIVKRVFTTNSILTKSSTKFYIYDLLDH